MTTVQQLRQKLLALGDLTVSYTPQTRIHGATVKIGGQQYSSEGSSESNALTDLLRQVQGYTEQATLGEAIAALREVKNHGSKT